MCEAFPNFENLLAEQLSMIRIENLALHNCKQLTYASFWNNELESLNKNLFEGSPKLQFIIFQENRLKMIDVNMFLPVPNLKGLYLGDNHLTELPIQDFPTLRNLNHLSIDFNNLTDLDEQSLVLKSPKLQEIHLQGNGFDCDRLRIIIDVLRDNNIEPATVKDAPASPNANSSHIEGVECVTKAAVKFSVEKSVNHLMIIGVGVLLLLLNLLTVIGYVIWRKFC